MSHYTYFVYMQDFSKGTRLTELNVLLSQTVMVCSCSLSYINLNAYRFCDNLIITLYGISRPFADLYYLLFGNTDAIH
jgi:hypothetical protein